jgi:hypothetical protein
MARQAQIAALNLLNDKQGQALAPQQMVSSTD